MEDLMNHPAVQRMGELAGECMEATGVGVLSLPDIDAWVKQGKPKTPTPHRWTDPCDRGTIQCVWCGMEDDFDERNVFWCPEPQAN